MALVMTMLLSILLGTGIPTVPTYIITAALAAPALAKLGVPLIVSHMFAFYYGIMADLSPPVALAALAAAPIAKENPDKIGWEAMRIPLAGYIIPFVFVYSPALMLQAGDPMATQLGFYGAVAFATFKALVAIGLFGIVAIGFLFARLTLLERAVAFLAALCLLGDFRLSDTAGFILTVAIVLWQWRQREPLSCLAWCREDAVGGGIHAGVDPLDRKGRLAGGLAHRSKGARTGAGARKRFRRRHGAAGGWASRQRLVSMATEACADAGGGGGQFRRRRRLATL
jgi:hypothetical protein